MTVPLGVVNLDVLPKLTQGLEVAFPRPLEPHAQRLMDTLGVVVRLPSDHPAGSMEAAAVLRQADQGISVARCSRDGCDNPAAWTRGKFAYLCTVHARNQGWRGQAPGSREDGTASHRGTTTTAIAVDDPLLRAEQKVTQARKDYAAAQKHLDRQKKRAERFVRDVKSAQDSLEGHRQKLHKAIIELREQVELLEPVRR